MMSAEHTVHQPKSFITKYIFSMDHKVIGIQYLITAIIMAIVGITLSMIIRAQLGWPDKAVVKPEQYLSLVTMHGTIMVFFVVSFALVSGFGNFLIPLHIGARDMAYPFLNMLSYWVVVPACVLMIASFFVEGGAAAAGWTAYPPLSGVKEAVPGSGMGQSLWLSGMALFIASFTMGSLNYMATIFNQRTKGMSMMRMPLVIWTFLLSAILGLLAFPAITAAAVMLLLDRHAGTSFFLPSGMIMGDKILPNQGGTPLLFQHLFWFMGHPEVYVLILPAIGIAFEVIACSGRRPPFGYKSSVTSLIVIGFLSMIVWGHHMFASGMNPYVGEYFSIVTLLITIPFAILGVNLIASLWRAKLRATTATLFGLGIISAIGTGGLGGLYLGTASADIYFHETYFVVGHFHFMIGVVTFFGIFAGLYHWFPKMFGRHMNEALGKWHFWLTLVPLFGLLIMMHYLGLGGALRRTYNPLGYNYLKDIQGLHRGITIAAFIVGAAQIIFIFNFFLSMFLGKKAEQNPWKANTLEWTLPSPPPHGNWRHELPEVHRWPYDYGTNGIDRDFIPQDVPTETKG